MVFGPAWSSDQGRGICWVPRRVHNSFDAFLDNTGSIKREPGPEASAAALRGGRLAGEPPPGAAAPVPPISPPSAAAAVAVVRRGRERERGRQ